MLLRTALLLNCRTVGDENSPLVAVCPPPSRLDHLMSSTRRERTCRQHCVTGGHSTRLLLGRRTMIRADAPAALLTRHRRALKGLELFVALALVGLGLAACDPPGPTMVFAGDVRVPFGAEDDGPVLPVRHGHHRNCGPHRVAQSHQDRCGRRSAVRRRCPDRLQRLLRHDVGARSRRRPGRSRATTSTTSPTRRGTSTTGAPGLTRAPRGGTPRAWAGGSSSPSTPSSGSTPRASSTPF